MDDNNIVDFPDWNNRVDAATRFSELADIARRKPHMFSQVVVLYFENDDKRSVTRFCTIGNPRTSELIGMLEMGKHHVFNQRRT